MGESSWRIGNRMGILQDKFCAWIETWVCIPTLPTLHPIRHAIPGISMAPSYHSSVQNKATSAVEWNSRATKLKISKRASLLCPFNSLSPIEINRCSYLRENYYCLERRARTHMQWLQLYWKGECQAPPPSSQKLRVANFHFIR